MIFFIISFQYNQNIRALPLELFLKKKKLETQFITKYSHFSDLTFLFYKHLTDLKFVLI